VKIQQLRFRQSGGFANVIRGVDVAAGDLTAAHRRALTRFANAKSSDSTETRSPTMRDQIVFELTLTTDAGTRRLEFDEMSFPAGLGPLVLWLKERSRPVPP